MRSDFEDSDSIPTEAGAPCQDLGFEMWYNVCNTPLLPSICIGDSLNGGTIRTGSISQSRCRRCLRPSCRSQCSWRPRRGPQGGQGWKRWCHGDSSPLPLAKQPPTPGGHWPVSRKLIFKEIGKTEVTAVWTGRQPDSQATNQLANFKRLIWGDSPFLVTCLALAGLVRGSQVHVNLFTSPKATTTALAVGGLIGCCWKRQAVINMVHLI